LTLNEIELS